MCKQSDLIDLLKGRLRLSSDYAIAQRWGVEPTRISQYRRNRLRLPIEFIIDIAKHGQLDALELVRLLELERARKNGQDISKRIQWRPNENVRRYAPDWVKRQHHHRDRG